MEDEQTEEYYGKALEYEPEFQGPRKYRKSTDAICLYFFIGFLVIWLAIGTFAFIKGDVQALNSGSVEGHNCGVDEAVRDKPNYLYLDLLKCSKDDIICSSGKICVRDCPTEEFLFLGVGDEYRRVICEHGYSPSNNNEAAGLIAKGLCTKYYFPAKEYSNRCVPTQFNFPNILNYLKQNSLHRKNVTAELRANSQKIKVAAATEQLGDNVLRDLKHGAGYIVAALLIAIGATIIYLVVMRWIAGVMVWLSLIVVGLALVAVTGFLFYSYTKAKEDDKTALLIVGIISLVFLILYIVMLFVMRKRIKLAIALIKESSKAIGDMVSALFFPVLPSILQMLVIMFGVGCALFLSTIGDPYYQLKGFDSSECKCSGDAIKYNNNTECDPVIFMTNCFKNAYSQQPCSATCEYKGIKQSVVIYILHGFNIFGTYWGIFFLYAFVEMVLAGAFATWYWTMPKSNLESFPVTSSLRRTFRYHLGTIAFGSLIITIIRMVRLLLNALQENLKKSDSGAARILVACLECLFEWLERVMKFINRNAYILTAVHGYNFCKSAKEAFSLIMRNIVRVYVLDKVTDFLLGVSKFLLTICVSAIGYVMIEYISSYKFYSPAILILIIAVFTWIIATVFFNVFSMAVDTLFVCYLEDSERNDGSAERPYFMSHKLSKIFAKEE